MRNSHLHLNFRSTLLPIAAFLLVSPNALDAQIEDGAVPQAIEDISDASAPAPYAEFQYATVTGTSNVINVTMLPVVSSSGAITYKNLTLQFNVSSSGAITVASGSPKVVAAPVPQAANFLAGTYVGPSTVNGGENLITVSSPGGTAGGATEWSLAAPTGANSCTYPDSATWYVGPIASNPLASRLAKANITSTAYRYGILGSQPCVQSDYWAAGNILGFSQTGNKLTIVSFSYGGTEDYSTPQAQITYTLK
jgi:hypothetical protein